MKQRLKHAEAKYTMPYNERIRSRGNGQDNPIPQKEVGGVMDYVCNRCNAVFNENEAATESFFHNEVRPTFTENFIACPHCLSADYEDAAYCYRCKKPTRYKNLRGGYYCDDCIKDIRNRYHEARYVTLNIDDFAEWIHELRAKNHADEADQKDLM